MSVKLQPTLDKVAIKRHKQKDVSDGGIILPGQSNKKSNYGEVIAVGPGGFNQDGSVRPMGIKKGDIVFFTDDYYSTVVETGIVIVAEEDILAVVKD